ncbi:MAG: phosphoribosyltransferase family protein [Synechococcus sp. ELA057]
MRPCPPLWRDRREAGLALGHQLLNRGPLPADTLLLGLPRGGVLVAAAMAEVLQRPLRSWSVRKIADPNWPELAIGAIAPGDVCLWREGPEGPEQSRARQQGWLQQQQRELARRMVLYGDPSAQELKGRHLIAIDDGIATGMTALAGLTSLHQVAPASLMLAVPILDEAILCRMRPLVDALEVLAIVGGLGAVGAWYEHFPQLDDTEVLALLERHREGPQTLQAS